MGTYGEIEKLAREVNHFNAVAHVLASATMEAPSAASTGGGYGGSFPPPPVDSTMGAGEAANICK